MRINATSIRGVVSASGHSLSLALLAGVFFSAPMQAQISLTSAVDLALKSSPRVKMAQDDVAKAIASLQETHDLYIPSVTAGAALGQAYGYSPYPPTLLSGEAQSLVYNSTQFSYIKSARAGLAAASLSLKDARDGVSEDVALTYVSLIKDVQREAGLREEYGFAQRLVAITQERFDAGHDTAIDVTQARLTLANLNLTLIRAQDDTLNDQTHLATLTGLPAAALTADQAFPALPLPEHFTPGQDTLSAGIQAAFANATAKQFQARGDSRFLYRPDVRLIVQYNRYATFTNAFQNLKTQYPGIGANEEVFGVQINIPLFDKYRQAKGRETIAEAAHLKHDAENLRQQALDGQAKLSHSIRELSARMEVATLDQQLSQQQLDALVLELNRPPVVGRPPLSPKDEQNSRIAERERHLTVVDTTFQLRQLEINLLRQTGMLNDWLVSVVRGSAVPTVVP